MMYTDTAAGRARQSVCGGGREIPRIVLEVG
jgi:hypothetical protein